MGNPPPPLPPLPIDGAALAFKLASAPVWVPTFHRGSSTSTFLASFELTSAFKPFNYAPAGSAA